MKNQFEQPSVTLVTRNGSHKDRIFQSALPEWEIHRKDPGFDEDEISLRAPRSSERPVFIAEEKAKQDATWVAAICGSANAFVEGAKVTSTDRGNMYLYTDTVQFIHEPDGSLTIHEKPLGNPVVWAALNPDAMAQSGKQIEIVTALTAIRCDANGVSEPKTIIVNVEASMRPFSRRELVEYAKGSGNKTIPNTAGGISLANGGRSFYDTGKPLIVSVRDSINDTPTELLRYETWAHVPDVALRPFIVGAFEPAVVRLAEKTRTH